MFNPLLIVVLIVAFAGTAVGATGGTFLLGKANRAEKPTTLKNTAKGPALRLKTDSDAPNLKVSNDTRIPRLNADLVDGVSSEAFQRRVAGSCPADTAVRGVGVAGTVDCTGALASRLVRTIVVSPAATPAASGAALLAAVERADASADNPWLIKLEPGVYDLGARSLAMKPFLDLEGSGRETTSIMSNDSRRGAAGVVFGAKNSEVRDLTLRLTHVDGGGSGLAFSGERANGSTHLLRVRLVVDHSGRALFNYGGGNRIVAEQVIAQSPFLAVNENGGGSSIIFRNGEVLGTYEGTGQLVFIDSLIGGAAGSDNANARCLNSYSGSFAMLSTTCAPLP